MDNRNIDITNIMNEVLNNLKGFDVAASNPRYGKILVRYIGTTFCVTIEPMFNDNEKGKEADNKPFEEIVRSHSFIWDGELKSKENKIIDNRNTHITNIMNDVLNNLKGFDAATTNPREGIILVRYNGTTFCVTIEPVLKDYFMYDNEEKGIEALEIIGDVLNEHDKQLAILNKRLKKIEKIYKKHKKEPVNDKSIKTPGNILYCPYCGHESIVPVYNGYSCVKCKSYFVIEHDII